MESEKENTNNTPNESNTSLTDQYAKQSWKKGDQSKKLFVKNISHIVKDEDLAKYFSQWPDVALVRAFTVKSKGQHKHNGIGFVEFLTKEDADRVMKHLEGEDKILRGAKLDIKRALAKRDKSNEKKKFVKEEKPVEETPEEPSVEEEEESSSEPIDLEAKSQDEMPRTVFIRNLPTHPPTCLPNSKPFKIVDRLKRDIKFVAQKFGEVENVTVTIDKVTNLPIGTAFLLFKEPEAAQEMIEMSRMHQNSVEKSDVQFASEAINKARKQLGTFDDKQGGVFLYKVPISVFPAMTREDIKARNTSDEENQKIYDVKTTRQSRKLKEDIGNVRDAHLVAEGLILPGTDEAKETGISDIDLSLRMASWDNRKKKLRAPHFVVDPNRICIRNLPKTWDENRLNTAVRNAVALYRDHCIENDVEIEPKNPEDVEIKYLKIQKDEAGKSLSYGFVHFENHSDALCALRQLNNNPAVFTDVRRPIVEFALDNTHKTRRHMQENSKTKEERDAEREQRKTRFNDRAPRKQRR